MAASDEREENYGCIDAARASWIGDRSLASSCSRDSGASVWTARVTRPAQSPSGLALIDAARRCPTLRNAEGSFHNAGHHCKAIEREQNHRVTSAVPMRQAYDTPVLRRRHGYEGAVARTTRACLERRVDGEAPRTEQFTAFHHEGTPVRLLVTAKHYRLPLIWLSLSVKDSRLPLIALSLSAKTYHLPLTTLSLATKDSRLPLTALSLAAKTYHLPLKINVRRSSVGK